MLGVIPTVCFVIRDQFKVEKSYDTVGAPFRLAHDALAI